MAFSRWFKSLSIATLLTALPLTASLTHTRKAVAVSQYLQYYHLIDKQSGKCLGTEQGSSRPGTRVIMWSCNNNNDQLWISTETGVFKNANDMCLTAAYVEGREYVEGSQLDISYCMGSVGIPWTIYPDGAIRAGNTRLFMSAKGPNNNDKVILWHALNNGSQNWSVAPAVTIKSGAVRN